MLWLTGIPLASNLAAWIVRATKSRVSPFVADQAREAQNFQNTISLAMALAMIAFLLPLARFVFARGQGEAIAALDGVLLFVGLILALAAVDVAFSAFAAYAAYHGRLYRYPFCWRLLR